MQINSEGRVCVMYVMECSFSCTAGHYTEGSKTASMACTTGSPTPSRLGAARMATRSNYLLWKPEPGNFRAILEIDDVVRFAGRIFLRVWISDLNC